MTAVEFEPTQLALVELESTPLDHSGKLSCCKSWPLGSDQLLITKLDLTPAGPGHQDWVTGLGILGCEYMAAFDVE